MSESKKRAEAAAAAVLRVLSANPGPSGVDAAAEIIEIALHNAAREQEKRELQRVADLQASAHAHLTRLLNASPAVIYCRPASGDYQPTFVSDSISGCSAARLLNISPILISGAVAFIPTISRASMLGSTGFQQNDKRSIEYRIRRDDDAYFWVTTSNTGQRGGGRADRDRRLVDRCHRTPGSRSG